MNRIIDINSFTTVWGYARLRWIPEVSQILKKGKGEKGGVLSPL
jgi:hypothetical protein